MTLPDNAHREKDLRGGRADVVIETERLLLRPLTLDDVDLFVRLHADPRVTRFVPTFSHDQARERLADIEQQWAERGHGLCAVELKETGEFLGRCGLNYWEVFDEVEAGWTFTPASWGHGYATEAARACVARGFERLDVPYFTSMIAPANTASAKVAERLGFTPGREDSFLGKTVTVHILHREDPRWRNRPTGHTALEGAESRSAEGCCGMNGQQGREGGTFGAARPER